MTKLLIFFADVDPKFFYVFTTLTDTIVAILIMIRSLYMLIAADAKDKQTASLLTTMASPITDIIICSLWLVWSSALFFRFSHEQLFITFSHKIYFLVKYVFFIGLFIYYGYKMISGQALPYVLAVSPVFILMFLWNKMLLEMFQKPAITEQPLDDAETDANVTRLQEDLNMHVNTKATHFSNADHNKDKEIEIELDNKIPSNDKTNIAKTEVENTTKEKKDASEDCKDNINITITQNSNTADLDSRFLDAIYEHQKINHRDLNNY